MRQTRRLQLSRHSRVFALSAMLGLGSAGCEPRPDPPPEHPQPIGAYQDPVEVVRNALYESVDAWNRGDLEAHIAIYSDTGLGGPPFERGGRARARANLAPYFTDSRPGLRVDSLLISPLGPDRVIASGQYVLMWADRSGTGWFTEIWGKTPAGWRIVYEHSSDAHSAAALLPPFTPATLDSIQEVVYLESIRFAEQRMTQHSRPRLLCLSVRLADRNESAGDAVLAAVAAREPRARPLAQCSRVDPAGTNPPGTDSRATRGVIWQKEPQRDGGDVAIVESGYEAAMLGSQWQCRVVRAREGWRVDGVCQHFGPIT